MLIADATIAVDQPGNGFDGLAIYSLETKEIRAVASSAEAGASHGRQPIPLTPVRPILLRGCRLR